ncbi:GHMP kinase [Candidatus Woesearchaeota archaeon]|nr:GHMP kinase [Candidatus Woesearchaeota archaeon]
MPFKDGIFTSRAYSRAGLIGNPSDGFGGKTISFTIYNYYATIKLWPSEGFEIIPGEADRLKFKDDNMLVEHTQEYGYDGMVQIIAAAVTSFKKYFAEKGTPLRSRGYTIKYDTNIPRQRGMAGSSAVVTATIRALMEFYDRQIPKRELPNVILGAEKGERGINAGLQDRVVQTYGGMVYMDFSGVKDTLKDQGQYAEMDPAQLPPVAVAYIRKNGGEASSKVHSDVTARWERGEEEVVDAMGRFADLTDDAKMLIQSADDPTVKWKDLGRLMWQNWKQRTELYNIRSCDQKMIQAAREAGAYPKFAGSSGTAVMTYEDDRMFQALEERFDRLRQEDGIEAVIFRPTLLPTAARVT